MSAMCRMACNAAVARVYALIRSIWKSCMDIIYTAKSGSTNPYLSPAKDQQQNQVNFPSNILPGNAQGGTPGVFNVGFGPNAAHERSQHQLHIHWAGKSENYVLYVSLW